jgi:hypothetical protein
MKKITTFLLTSACALAITNNSLGMIKDPQDPGASFDVVASLTENNKLLHDIKRQNRSIIKQNYLNFQYHTLHIELCTSQALALSPSEVQKTKEKYQLAAKIKETYLNERLTDKSWSSSDEEDIFHSK